MTTCGAKSARALPGLSGMCLLKSIKPILANVFQNGVVPDLPGSYGRVASKDFHAPAWSPHSGKLRDRSPELVVPEQIMHPQASLGRSPHTAVIHKCIF